MDQWYSLKKEIKRSMKKSYFKMLQTELYDVIAWTQITTI